MQFEILGPLQVTDAGRPVPLGRPKQRAVLAILLLEAGRVVPLDRIVDLLWGERAPAQARLSVQTYVSHLRRLLEPDRPPGTPARILVNQAPGYRLDVPPGDLDADRFRALAERGRALLSDGAAESAAATFAEALRLWRGPVLADLADAPFVRADRARLEELRLSALEGRLAADLAVGAHAAVAAELEQLAAEHPFRERLTELRMVALYRCGRQAEALKAYREFAGALRDETGLDPGPALRRLQGDVLRQAPGLEHPSRSRRDALVGRDDALRVAGAALTATAAGRGRVLLVSGEPGIGKTRLAEEVARRAATAGLAVAWGRTDENDGAPPFWPWTQVLRDLSAELPADDGPALGPEAARFRRCRAAVDELGRLSANRPLLVVLDDLQWADAASHRLLAMLAPTLADRAIAVLVTYRTPVDASLTDTLADLTRAGVDRIELDGLAPDEVGRLMATRTGAPPDAGRAAHVAARTGGNPFFVLEIAAAGDARDIPAGVRDVLRRRLSRLPEPTRAVLPVAAVIGPEFDLAVLRDVAGLDQDAAIDAVDPALRSGLIAEDAAAVGRFRFGHALIREAVYTELSRVRRARLHERVGTALAGRGDGLEQALRLAHHWSLAGTRQGARHVLEAAGTCLDAMAYEQAERHLRRGLELLGDDQPAVELAARLRLGSLLVQLHGTALAEVWREFDRARELADAMGDDSALVSACRSLYEVAFARADHAGAGALAELLLDLSGDAAGHLEMGRTLWAQGRLPEARRHLERALTPDLDGPTLITTRLQLAAVLDGLGDTGTAAALVAAAVEGARAESPFARAAAVTAKALMAAMRRDVPTARAAAAEALELATRWRFPAPGGYAAMIVAWADALGGEAEPAAGRLERHLAELEAAGAQHLLAWGFGLLAECRLREKRPAEALRLVDDALARMERTGERLYEEGLRRLRAEITGSR